MLYWNSQPVEKVRDMQLKKFKEIFEYARENNPFYKALYSKAGVMDLNIQSWDDVAKIPIVDKDVYRSIPFEFRVSVPIDNRKHNTHTTSGSSGNPLKIAYEKWVDYSGHMRILYMLIKAAHYHPFKKVFMIARYEESEKFSIEKDLFFVGIIQKWFHLFRREIVSIYSDPDYIIDRIHKGKPDILWSTPSALESVVNRLIVKGDRLDVPYIITTSENISEIQMEKFHKFVSPTVIDLFGCMETLCISYRENGSGPGIVFSNAVMPEYVDICKRDGKDTGTLIVTSLINKVTPFIRYNLKDFGDILDFEGFPFKYIGSVIGRMDDVLTLSDGSPFFHHMAHEMYMDFTKCLHFKFMQVESGPIVLQLICNPEYPQIEVLEEAKERWDKHFPNEQIKIEFVDRFEINKRTGKYKNIEHLNN